MTATVAYNVKDAAEATGLSVDVIKRAIKSGDLRATRPTVDGRQITKDVIPAAELARWVGAQS